MMPGLKRLVRFIWCIELALQMRRERRALSALNDRMLKDIGLSRADAHAEASRSLWDWRLNPDKRRHDPSI